MYKSAFLTLFANFLKVSSTTVLKNMLSVNCEMINSLRRVPIPPPGMKSYDFIATSSANHSTAFEVYISTAGNVLIQTRTRSSYSLGTAWKNWRWTSKPSLRTAYNRAGVPPNCTLCQRTWPFLANSYCKSTSQFPASLQCWLRDYCTHVRKHYYFQYVSNTYTKLKMARPDFVSDCARILQFSE